ncbi:MAG: L-serine ammonia-lyase, partial [Phycisphaerae bacterium]|nr:L-serine ammonia-lyase [Phycisphaerae bacterium]
MEAISVFDIFKIGVGPSSSHTMGPWRAAQRFVETLRGRGVLGRVARVRCDLFGSLAKTGKGHGTDFAVMLGLAGEDPEACDTDAIGAMVEGIRARRKLALGGARPIEFDPATDLVFRFDVCLPHHPNAMTLRATLDDGAAIEESYYSVGGGFVVQEGETPTGARAVKLPHPIERGDELLAHCAAERASIPEIVRRNERAWRSDEEIDEGVERIWRVMQECIHRGCHAEGVLPGGLNVVRRGSAMNRKLLGNRTSLDLREWKKRVRESRRDFAGILKWVSTFALAVNEENASSGRVVTAPTNGAAGVIPAVMMYYDLFCDSTRRGLIDFMLTSAEVGSIFKKGATISAAMGGCQAEIGVSSAMAAAGLTQVMGGTPEQALMAAEIAMEHHLGMTCDPIAGLV